MPGAALPHHSIHSDRARDDSHSSTACEASWATKARSRGRGRTRQPFVTDWRGELAEQAAAVVRPATTAEVSAVVKLCYDNGIAIVPQGGNTGLMGGAAVAYAQRHPAVARSHEPRAECRSRRLCHDREAQATSSEASGYGRAPRPLLSAQPKRQGSCMIEGNLSTNAGGVQVLRRWQCAEIWCCRT